MLSLVSSGEGAPRGSGRAPKLVQGVDYYLENGNFVFTAHYHLKRGFCCNSGCRHCPYKEGTMPKVDVTVVGADALSPRGRNDA